MNDASSLSIAASLNSSPQAFAINVLLVDDQMIIAEAIKRMLLDQSDINFYYCSTPSQALAIAAQVKPTVILQDLVMPEINGLLLLKYFRANPATREIPIIILSTKEDPQIKAETFVLGANDYIIKLPDRLELIARIRYHSNSYIRLLERNEAYKRLEENQQILQQELSEAAAYVRSLLPVPLKGSIKIDWRFIPSTQLGGDTFGYYWLDENHFAIYLLDVCGHGVGSALHSISIANLLRSQNLPNANFYDPSSVLAALNQAFQMDQHNNSFFTIWYGIYKKETRQLIYASGGHPPAILITGETAENAEAYELNTPSIIIGAFPENIFYNATCQIKAYNQLYIFSDGVYEVMRLNGDLFRLKEFVDLLIKSPRKGSFELDYIVQYMQTIQSKSTFIDDFSLLQVIFE